MTTTKTQTQLRHRRPSTSITSIANSNSNSNNNNQNHSNDDDDDDMTSPPPPTLQTLPPELRLLISQHLIYPDALSLKHTCRAFYSLVDTGVRLKVDWLVQRRSLHLECPNDHGPGRCDLGSDLKFCRGSVRLLMERRREHGECETREGLGCLVYGTRECGYRHLRGRGRRWRRWWWSGRGNVSSRRGRVGGGVKGMVAAVVEDGAWAWWMLLLAVLVGFVAWLRPVMTRAEEEAGPGLSIGRVWGVLVGATGDPSDRHLLSRDW